VKFIKTKKKTSAAILTVLFNETSSKDSKEAASS
jgi:hypothetical protein